MVLILFIVLCIVFVRWSYQKSIPSNNKNNNYKKTTATNSVFNPEYSSMKSDTNYYDYIDNDVIPNPHQDQSMSNSYELSNRAYGGENDANVLDSNVTIQPNPCYSVAEHHRKLSKKQFGYVEPKKFTKHPLRGHTDAKRLY